MNAPEVRILTDRDEVAGLGRTAEALIDAYATGAAQIEVKRPRWRFRATRERLDFAIPEQSRHITLAVPGWDPAEGPCLPWPVGVEFRTFPPSPPGHVPPGAEVLREATAEEIGTLVGMVNETSARLADYPIEIVDGGPDDPFIEVDVHPLGGAFTALVDAPSWNRQQGPVKRLHRPWVRGVWWLFHPLDFLSEIYTLELDA